MNDPKVKQQIANKIKDVSNILVTVSNNPSVDELSAALGLTLLLNKMEKHATAVFSGKVPPAITFLDPEKTFEETTDSLRDFIIALDKEKADHLRYKLEGDLVKIYITPYRTTITSDDLEFSQGDYNVELVIALGVEDKSHLDTALNGHGKILHDATVVTATAGEQVSNLGSIDWHESNASSLSEMLVTLHDSMKLDKSLLDHSIATAWMTGVVAATDRFSNPRTSSRVMTIAAQLMAAGADQQLIATRLAEAAALEAEKAESNAKPNADGRTDLSEGKSTKLPKEKKQAEKKPRPDGELVIDHAKDHALDEAANTSGTDRLEESARAAQRALEKQEELAAQAASAAAPETPAPTPESPVSAPEEVGASPELPEPSPAPAPHGPVNYPSDEKAASIATEMKDEPMFGGTLNATSEQAEADKRRAIEADKSKVILSHGGYIGSQENTHNTSVNRLPNSQDDTPPAVDVFKNSGPVTSSPIEPPSTPTVAARDVTPPSQATPQPSPPPAPELPQTLADIDQKNRAPQSEALAAVQEALSAAPDQPAVPTIPPAPVTAPEPSGVPAIPPLPQSIPDLGGLPLPPPPPLPDFSANQGGVPPLPSAAPTDLPPERLGDIFAPDQQQPSVATPPAPTEPGQFKIPGQQ